MFGYVPMRPWFGGPAWGFNVYPPAFAAQYGMPYPYAPYSPFWRPRFGRMFWGRGRGGGRGRGWGFWCTPAAWW